MYGTRTPYPYEYEYVQIPKLMQYCTRTLKIFKELEEKLKKFSGKFLETFAKIF